MRLSTQPKPSALRQALIDMSGAGQGETGSDDNVLKRFLPLPEHARIFEPESFLVIGHRGAGKTELFRALQTLEGITSITSVTKRFDAQRLRNTHWLIGYSSTGADFPAELIFQQFTKGKGPIELQFVWLGYLLRVLEKNSVLQAIEFATPLREAVAVPNVDIARLFEAVRTSLHGAISAIDSIDASLARQDRWVFVTYDELDRVSSSDWEQLATIIRGLIQFWSSNARRWRRIRPKIFLRRDLFDRAAIVGPDVSKISAQRLELTWTTRDLYALLAKRFYNQAPRDVSSYLGKALPEGETRGHLGWFPTASRSEDYRPMVEHICGEFMGASAGKGRTFTWIPTHLQDGHGQVLPRSFVKLFEKAAGMENSNPKAETPRLLHHTALRGALDKVSLDRMEEFKEELPWIERVRSHLVEANFQVPIDRQQIQRSLGEIDWSQSPERPPQVSGYDLVQYLGELGIFYMREDNRVDVRDIYLDGLGFKRKGGVKKPF